MPLNRKYIYIFLKSCLRLSVVALGGKITDTKMTSLTHANMHGEASLSQVISKSALVCGLKAWLCVFKEIKKFKIKLVKIVTRSKWSCDAEQVRVEFVFACCEGVRCH